MIHIMQGHNNCGQTTLAIITGNTIDYVSRQIRKKGGTRAKDYIDFLESHGYTVVNKKFKVITKNTVLPKLCIIKGHNIPETSYTHVLVHYDGYIFDPSWPNRKTYNNYMYETKGKFRITSYMEIKADVYPKIKEE